MKRIVALILLTAAVMADIFSLSEAEGRMKKIYLGRFYISSYNREDNTPRNSRATASGKLATVGRTVAVDASNPIVPMGSTVIIEGLGHRKVEDTGGFGRYNGGMRKFDVYMPVGQGFLKKLKTWLIRPETKEERKKRLEIERKRRLRREKRLRKKRQKGTFSLKYHPYLADWEIITDPKYIKSGTVRIGTKYLDVRQTKKGLKNTILIGDPEIKDLNMTIKTKLDEVCEEAKG